MRLSTMIVAVVDDDDDKMTRNSRKMKMIFKRIYRI